MKSRYQQLQEWEGRLHPAHQQAFDDLLDAGVRLLESTEAVLVADGKQLSLEAVVMIRPLVDGEPVGTLSCELTTCDAGDAYAWHLVAAMAVRREAQREHVMSIGPAVRGEQ